MEKRLRWLLSNIVVVKTLLKLYVVMPATVLYHTAFTFTSVVRVSIYRSDFCSLASITLRGSMYHPMMLLAIICIVSCLVFLSELT